MGAAAPNTTLQSVRKAIACQNAYLIRGRDVRRHHHATLDALRLAETLLLNGFDLDRVRMAIEATAGGGDCNPLIPVTDQHFASPLVHAPTLSGRHRTNAEIIPDENGKSRSPDVA